MLTQEKIYTLVVKGQRIPVTQTVYKAYYQEYEHERYLKKKSVAYERSLEQLLDAGVSVDFHCTDGLCPVEDKLIAAEQVRRLHDFLSQLSSEEQTIIVGIFFYEQPAKSLAWQLGISSSAVGHRKQKALQKLKQLLAG